MHHCMGHAPAACADSQFGHLGRPASRDVRRSRIAVSDESFCALPPRHSPATGAASCIDTVLHIARHLRRITRTQDRWHQLDRPELAARVRQMACVLAVEDCEYSLCPRVACTIRSARCEATRRGAFVASKHHRHALAARSAREGARETRMDRPEDGQLQIVLQDD